MTSPVLEGQVALVTGASAPRGIGRACALRLAGLGAAVVIGDLPGAPLDRLGDVVAEIEASGGRALAVPLDVTDPGQITEAVSAGLTAFGRIDILVNNAGSLAGSDAFLSTTPEGWQASFDVNIMGPMRLCQAVLPGMRERGAGRIINIGSTGSLGAEAGFGAYTAMKHALVGLTKTLAAEFGVDGILCNTVCPGYIATDMHAVVALRDAGLPEDVADAVAYLAGPQSKYVTGISLPVAGGVPFGI